MTPQSQGYLLGRYKRGRQGFFPPFLSQEKAKDRMKMDIKNREEKNKK